MTVVAYINAFGGIRSENCNTVVKQLWDWCIDRNLWVSACNIAGSLNVAAERASRGCNDRTEWVLEPDIFQQITD